MGIFEHTFTFLAFLFLWLLGMLLAAKYVIGPLLAKPIRSFGTALSAA